LSMLTRPSTGNFQISPVLGEKVYIPSKTRKQLVLSPNPKILATGQNVSFNVTLVNLIEASGSKKLVMPVRNKQVDIWEVKPDQIEQEVQLKKVGTAFTDETGKCSMVYNPGTTAQYRAYAKEPDGTIITTSAVVTVSVTANNTPPKIKNPIILKKTQPEEKVLK
jgi:hypothetical protein